MGNCDNKRVMMIHWILKFKLKIVGSGIFRGGGCSSKPPFWEIFFNLLGFLKKKSQNHP